MVIAIFPSLEGESLEDFSIRLAERWRIGDKKLDNGVILLVFVQERRIRLEVGYGLEPVLPDAVASQIIREQIGPRFREGRWADGLLAAVEAVFARIDTKGASAPPPPQRHAFGVSPLTLGLLVVFGLVALMLMREASRGGGRRNAYSAGGRRGWGPPPVFFPGGGWRGGGGGGGGGGGFSGGGGSFGGGGASGDW
jgi:uncharacterized protein